MANTVYDNFYLSNEIEDQYKSHLDLQTFCTVDNALEGTAGMLRKINVYKATDGTEKLAMGAGNSKSIEVGFTPREYRIQLAQNRFKYYDEQAMTDPQLVPVGTKHMGTDMFNTVNADIYGEFAKATQVVVVTKLNFDAFADAQSVLALEDLEGVTIFAFVSPADVAELRKELKDTLQYVEAFAKNGYIGTVAGVNIYTKKDAVSGSVYMATNAVRDYTVYMTVDHQTENTAGGSGDASFASHKHAYKGKKAFKVHLGLKAGEQVLLLRTDGGQKFIIIDRVEAPT